MTVALSMIMLRFCSQELLCSVLVRLNNFSLLHWFDMHIW
uniref:Uncharacterized protein n=1 Tax=Arundo donax TaxID=35708 RepID=A0A0A9H5Z6_ARUDO